MFYNDTLNIKLRKTFLLFKLKVYYITFYNF